MFDYLVEDNDLKPVMEEHGLLLPQDLDFIKEQIAGPLDTSAGRGNEVRSLGLVLKGSYVSVLRIFYFYFLFL